MEYAYWKPYDNKNYSFEEALKVIQEHKDVQMRVHQNDSYKEIRIDRDSLPKNINDISIPLWAIKDPYWHLYIPDYDMEEKVDDIRDYFNSIYEVDSRFWNVDKMDVSQIFDEIDNHVLNDDLRMEIILWLRDNNKIKLR